MNQKRAFTDYPQSYFELLEKMQNQSELFIAIPSATDARAQIHDLYRFFRALDRAYATDEFARKYADISRNLMLTYVGPPSPGFTIRKRPLVIATQRGALA